MKRLFVQVFFLVLFLLYISWSVKKEEREFYGYFECEKPWTEKDKPRCEQAVTAKISKLRAEYHRFRQNELRERLQKTIYAAREGGYKVDDIER